MCSREPGSHLDSYVQSLRDLHLPLGHPLTKGDAFHDFGGLGLGLWLAFHVSATVTRFLRARRSGRADGEDYAYHLVAFLALVALAPAMFTDNAVSYAFVMMPLGIVVGCSLGRWRVSFLPSHRGFYKLRILTPDAAVLDYAFTVR